MRRGRIILGIILVIGVILQLIRPEKNIGDREEPGDMLVQLSAPAEVKELIHASCYDCHSDHTKYPWYGNISPLSWYLHRHIMEGKEAANFSAFGEEGKSGQIALLSELCEVLDAGVMPPPSYLLLHGEAALDGDETAFLCDWAESESLGILRAGR